jgi:uncharacterized membrane protein
MSAPDQGSGPGLATPPVRTVDLARPLRWLILGWRDFMLAPLPSALHGLILALGGLTMLVLSRDHLHLLAGAFSAFLLVAPILLTGIYELSRRLALGEAPTLLEAVRAWRCSCRCLIGFGLLLTVMATFWLLVSSVLIALFVHQPITGLESFVRHVVLSQSSNLFVIWISLGGVIAALVFAASVVTVPMLLDRDTDMLTAVLTSLNAVSANPLALALWASIIMVLTALGMATLFIGLVLVIPVLGHASWHAYAELVDASALPPRSR